jgi:MGT family glycosyltransferase
MARFLFGTVPSTGHVTPLLPLARALVADGHTVRWLSGDKHRARIEAIGAVFEPYRATRDLDESRLDEAFPGRARLRGLAAIKFDIKHAFLDPGLDQLDDLERLYAARRFDVIVADVAFLGAQLFHERTGLPLVIVNVSALFIGSRDVPPLGLALAPSASRLGVLRNRLLQRAIQDVLLRDVRDHYHALRRRAGLSPRAWFIDCHERCSVLLHPSIPGLEYPRSDLPDNVVFIGQLPSEPAPQRTLPAWFHELDGARPVVHVTQGTIANARPDLFAPALAGLAREDVLLVVTTGHREPSALGLGPLPDNARVAPFIPHAQLLPKTRVMITNGGFGGVQVALSHGVPLLVAGASEEKPEIAARVAYSGAGLNLKTGTPSARSLRRSVRRLLDDRAVAQRARALAEEYRRYDALALARAQIARFV